MKPVYIVDGSRTPFLKARGKPGPFSAAELGTKAAKSLLLRQPFSPSDLDQVIVGCVGPSPDEANIARIIALRVGCGDSIPAYTVQRNCASGLQALESGAQSIREGQANLVLCGGTEAMSHAPLLLNRHMVMWLAQMQKAKTLPAKLQSIAKFHPKSLKPVIAILRGLNDPVIEQNMGQTAEELAYLFNITREDMDEYAVRSHQRAVEAQTQDDLEDIVPLYDDKGNVYEKDDGIRPEISLEKLGTLRTAFEKHGMVTAGNSSQISDGAAFVVLASEEAVKQYQLPVLARLVETQWAALDPMLMGLGPIYAMTPLLNARNLSLSDIDHIEINEAFAAQVLACWRAWRDTGYCKEHFGTSAAVGEMQDNQLNPQGGAIALGHPVGASGARLALHSAFMIHKHQLNRAVASLCIGGGQGGAMLIEKV